MRPISIIIAVIFLSTALNAGGGWPQPKGKGYLKLSEWWIISDQHFTDTGAIDPNVTTGLFNTNLYFEYGLTDKFTIITNGAIFSRSYNNNIVSGTTGEILDTGDAINGIGDIDLSLKYGLFSRGGFSGSASLTFGLPLGEEQGGPQKNLQLGDGEFNQMLQFDLGKSFNWGYGNAYAAYNNRTEGFSDEFRFGVEAGTSILNSRLSLTMRVFGILSLQNGAENLEPVFSSVFANNTEHVSFQPEVNYNFNDKYGISVSAGGAFYGRLIFASPSYSVGFYAKI